MSTITLTSRCNTHTSIHTMSIISTRILFLARAQNPILTSMRTVGYGIVMLISRIFITGTGTITAEPGLQLS